VDPAGSAQPSAGEITGDPRVYFAAERTLLAWIRTGIGVMAFGFVVARFGLLLHLLGAGGATVPRPAITPWLGALLVLLGAIATAGGTVQYRAYTRRLRPTDLPGARLPLLPTYLAWSLVLLGVVLTGVLLS
jgi:putative membrane protein